jgi:hypothetical protein
MDEHGIEYMYFRAVDRGWGQEKPNIGELNKLLQGGWFPVRESPLGSSAALVLLRRKIKVAEVVMTELLDDELDASNNRKVGEKSTPTEESSDQHTKE